ncbi:PQQ-binding-like beta-propeller repeat protein [Telmatocola sphagniphila]|uniref:PQQ-binding-like beta-propeller repeat protein n=1 Tax=Telmatocola sphagniphila TaxID=1123043 RepID=A0A8E6B5A4_9BACT|nr:PQQ-like beta-propeller repeat protein [Telmatocola sphagniphila]QVL31709.1 PQQ-binding-like beta-propeller repeat protein [Telmatocola sphagniphila]
MRRFVYTVSLSAVLFSSMAADWTHFRGSDSTGVGSGDAVPLPFGPKQQVAWKADLPGRGLSSPVLVDNKAFLTASSGEKQNHLHVLAYDTKTGQRLWQRTVWATGPTDTHSKTCPAAPTPVSDGKYLVALFATNDLICLDLEGNLQWIRSLHEENPGATDGRGLASSPLIINSTIIVQCENQNTSFAAGIDISTGKNRWQQARPRELSWSSPISIPGKSLNEPLALIQGNNKLSAYEPLTGKEIWAIQGRWHPFASCALKGRLLLVPGENKLFAYELQDEGVPPKLLWEQSRLNPSTASPLIYEGKIYSLRGSILASGELKTGNILNQIRLKGGFSSSLVVAGGLLFCVNEDGLVHVVRPGEEDPVLVDSYPFEETILSTPAATGGALYLRSDKHFWKVGKH